jgi:hypothetical protein
MTPSTIISHLRSVNTFDARNSAGVPVKQADVKQSLRYRGQVSVR